MRVGSLAALSLLSCTQVKSLGAPDAGNGCPPGEVELDGMCSCGSYGQCSSATMCFHNTCHPGDQGGANCEFDAECDGEFCIGGHCTWLACSPEVCNSVDDDCNGFIDDIEPTECYAGPPESEGIGLCQSGLSYCVDGAWSACAGDAWPVIETGPLACDGLDNDCNGCADNHYDEFGNCIPAPERAFDVAFLIDYSGSMSQEIAAIIAATEQVTWNYAAFVSYRWALVGVPQAVDGRDGQISVITDFTDTASFIAALRAAGTDTTGGCEPTESGAYKAVVGPLISWRQGTTTVLVLFTDEVLQNCRLQSGLSVSYTDLCNAVTARYVKMAIVTYLDLAAHFICPTIAKYELTTDAATMALYIEQLLTASCP